MSDGYYYFPLIKYLALIDFNISFDKNIENLRYIPLPLGGIIFHSFLLKVFDNFFISIFIIELLSLYLYLTIFFLIFNTFLKEYVAIILSLLFFSIPLFVDFFNLNLIPYVSLLETNLYTSRVPRPIITSLYYFFIVYLFIKFELKIFQVRSLSISFSIITGLLLTAFYYYFFVIFVLIIIIFLNNLKYIKQNLKNFKFIELLAGLLIVIPFFLIIFFHEPDFMERMGSIDLNLENKKKLIFFYITKLIEIKFLLILLMNTFLYFMIQKLNYSNNFIEIFYKLIFSSIFAPIIFILVSPKINIYYHFNNIIVIHNLIFLLFSILIFLQKYLNKFSSFRNFIITSTIILIFHCYENYTKIDNKDLERESLISLINEIKDSNKIRKNSNILTFDPKIMVWLIINNYKEIKLLNGNFTSKKNRMIEKDLILSLKLLNYNIEDFKNFIKNKESNWRYLNLNVQKFFFLRYQANAFITYKNSLDFTSEETKTIKKSSPFLVQQSIIPKFEINRLTNLFKNFSLDKVTLNEYPEILILRKNEYRKALNFNKINYCVFYENEKFKIYELRIGIDNC